MPDNDNKNNQLAPLSSLGTGGQRDGMTYHSIEASGAEGYSAGNYEQPSEEDLALAAKNVAEYAARYHSGKPMEHYLAAGVGTNLIPEIMASGYTRELTCIERSAANIATREDWLNRESGNESPRWENWREIIGILYAQGENAPSWLNEARQEHIRRIQLEELGIPQTGDDIYAMLQNWGDLDQTDKDRILDALVPEKESNPYLSSGSVPELLRGKVTHVLGDGVEHIHGDTNLGLADLTPYINSAEVVCSSFYDESVVGKLLELAHVNRNTLSFAKDGAMVIRNQMERTHGYDTFGTGDLEECYATSRVLQSIAEQQMNLFETPSQGAAIGDDASKVREGYGDIVGYTGEKLLEQPADARELLRNVMTAHPDIRVITFETEGERRRGNTEILTKTGYCFAGEAPSVMADLARNFAEKHPGKEFTVKITDLQAEIDRGTHAAQARNATGLVAGKS